MVNAQLGQVLRQLRRWVGGTAEEAATDGQLLERFAVRREEAAFAALVMRYGPMVLGVCRRVLQHEQDAEDAFQATFLVLARKAGSIRRRESVGGWLYEVAYHIAVKARAGAARRRLLEQQVSEMFPTDSPEEAGWRELRPVLDEELSRLPRKYRDPLVSCYLQGKTNRQAADELGWPAGSMSRRLERARELLRDRLVRRGITLSTGVLAAVLAENASATVPATMLAPTVRAAMLFTAGNTVAVSALSAPAAQIAQGVLKTMFYTKLKIAVAALLAVSVVTGGAGVVTNHVLNAHQPGAGPQSAAPAKEPAKDQRPAKEDPKKDAAPPKPAPDKPVPADSKSDPLPAGALVRMGTPPTRTGVVVTAVAFSPDGRFIASTSTDQTLRLWDVGTGREVRRCADHKGAVLSVVFSPDGKLMASAGEDGTIVMWDIQTGKIIAKMAGAKGPVRAVALSPDGRTLAAGSDDKTVQVWDLPTLKQTIRIEGKSPVRSLAFSPDGKKIATAGDDGIVLLADATTGEESSQLKSGQKGIARIAFSPDGSRLASVGKDRSIVLWEVANAKQLFVAADAGKVHSVAAFSPTGKLLVTGGADGTVRLWDMPSTKELVARQLKGHQGTVVCAAVSPDEKVIVTGGTDGLVKLWETDSGKECLTIAGHGTGVATDGIFSVAFSRDGKQLATGDSEKRVRLWDAAKGTPLHDLKGHEAPVFVVALSPDGATLASADNKGNIRLWNTSDGKELRQLPRHAAEVPTLAFSPDSQTLASAGFEQSIRLWRVKTGESILRIPAISVMSLSFSPDGKKLAGGMADPQPGGMIRIWETGTGKMIREWQGHPQQTWSVAFSSDGKTLASGGRDGTIRLWDAEAGQEFLKFAAHNTGVRQIAFSPNDRTLISIASDGSSDIRLWEVASGKERGRLTGHRSRVWSVSFSSDGHRLASGGADHLAYVWDVTGRMKDGKLPPVELSAKELDALWAELASDDGARAYRAIWTLTAGAKDAIPLLRKQVQPATSVDEKRIAKLIGDLDNDTFAVREKASEELEQIGEAAGPALRQAMRDNTSVELRRRADALLNKLKERVPSPQRLRPLRAVETLEHIGTAEAKQVLQGLAKGSGSAELTQQAKAALERLKKNES